MGHQLGAERDIAVLFADLRAFTRLSEDKLPCDMVFLVNRFFLAMGRAIEGEGGHADRFIGGVSRAVPRKVPRAA